MLGSDLSVIISSILAISVGLYWILFKKKEIESFEYPEVARFFVYSLVIAPALILLLMFLAWIFKVMNQ